MATINQAVPTRRVTTDPGGYYYFNRWTNVSVTAHTSTTTATESSTKSGGISGAKDSRVEQFTGTIRHDYGSAEPDGSWRYPGYATVHPGGEILNYVLLPFEMTVLEGGIGYDYITFGKKDWGGTGSTEYRVSIMYATGTYSGSASGNWEHTLSGISISNEWCSSGTLSVSTTSTGFTASVTGSSESNPSYSFNYSGTYTTSTISYYGTGSISYYGDIMSVTSNFGSVYYSVRDGTTIDVTVVASTSGTARVTANLRGYNSPTYGDRADVRFTGYYANGARANNVLVDYVNFNGNIYP